MQSSGFLSWLQTLQHQSYVQGHRRLVVLVGEEAWISDLFLQVQSLKQKTVVYSAYDEIKPSIDIKHFKKALGGEQEFVLFADSGINLDAFAALSGTLVSGGTFFFAIKNGQLAEKYTQVEVSNSSAYFQQHLKNNEQVIYLFQDKPLPEFKSVQKVIQDKQLEQGATHLVKEPNTSRSDNLCFNARTVEQQCAIEKVLKVHSGRRDRPLILTADRGRGKSTALALACVEILKRVDESGNKTSQHIIITAAHQDSTEVFFKHLLLHFPAKQLAENGSKLLVDNHIVEFIAIDQLIKNSKVANLLLVDEAASVPVYLLTQLISKFHRIVFSTTMHGYEGSGRGFNLKFRQKLHSIRPHYQSYHIKQPIRWQLNDPLETFVFNSCLLNAELPDINQAPKFKEIIQLAKMPARADNLETSVSKEIREAENTEKISTHELLANCQFEVIDKSLLLKDSKLFNDIFSVLVTAHYQTSPSDISLVLDNNNVSIVVLKYDDTIVSVGLLVKEGLISRSSVDDVSSNKRRLKDQFIPQSLLTHCGFQQSFDFSYLRIMRIAVHPEVHQCGLGSTMLEHIENHALENNIDMLGSSFGGNHSLINFWLKSGYQLARIGFSKDKASGEHSALITKALTNKSTSFNDRVIMSFYRQFDYLLTDEYQMLVPSFVGRILKARPATCNIEFTEQDENAIEDYIANKRLYSACVYSIHKWCLLHFTQLQSRQLTHEHQLIAKALVMRVLQKRSVEDVCKYLACTGKKALQVMLKSYISFHHRSTDTDTKFDNK